MSNNYQQLVYQRQSIIGGPLKWTAPVRQFCPSSAHRAAHRWSIPWGCRYPSQSWAWSISQRIGGICTCAAEIKTQLVRKNGSDILIQWSHIVARSIKWYANNISHRPSRAITLSGWQANVGWGFPPNGNLMGNAKNQTESSVLDMEYLEYEEESSCNP